MKKALMTASVAAVVVGLVTFPPASAKAAENDKITICHRTNSVKNPYVKITVDKSAADGKAGNSKGQADHFGEHKGPIATSQSVAQGYKNDKKQWGDIIPPIAGAHKGLNWTTQGQAIYKNGCKYASSSVNTTGGGLGGGEEFTPRTGQSSSSQVKKVPGQGGVNAGSGGLAGSAGVSIAAVGGSLFTLGYGLLRLRKFND